MITEGYAIRKSNTNEWFSCFNKTEDETKTVVEFVDSNLKMDIDNIEVLNSVVEAKEIATLLNSSKWLPTSGQDFEVVEVVVSNYCVEWEYDSWWRKLFDSPKRIEWLPAIVSEITIWSTAD